MSSHGWSLQARLKVLFVATIIPVVGLGIYWLISEAQHERAHAEREASEMTARVAAQAADVVGDVQGMLAVLARLPLFRAEERARVDRLLHELVTASPYVENISVFKADGALYASAVPVAAAGQVLVHDRAWFQAAVRSRQPVASGFLISRLFGKPVVVLALPLLDGEGRILGVVGAALQLEAVGRKVAPAQLRLPALWAIVDDQGLVLLHDDPNAPSGKPLGPLPGVLRAESAVPGTQWRAIVAIGEAVVAARVRSSLLEIGLPAVLILLVASGVGFWIARNTWRPLQALTVAVRRIGAGEREVQLPVQSTGEVAEVAGALQDALGAVAAREADLTRRHRELAALVEATKVVASPLDLEQSLQAIVQQATIISRTNIVRLFLLDQQAKVLRCRVVVGLPVEENRDIVIPVGESFLSGQVATSGRPLAVADIRNDPRLINPQHAAKHGLVSYLGLPVKLGDRVVGVLVFNTQAPRTYSDEEITYLSAFAEQAAIAIENARLYEVARRELAERTRAEEALAQRTQQLEAVRAVTTEITRELDLPTLLELINRRAAELVGATSGTVRLWDEEAKLLIPVAWHGLGEWVKDQCRRLGEGVTGIVAQRREGMIVNDYRTSPYAQPATLEHSKITAILGEPLVYRDHLLGALTVDKHGPGSYFTEEEHELFRLFADQAAIAIENARLHERLTTRLKRQQALTGLSQLISSSLNVDAVLSEIAQAAAELMGDTQVTFWTVDEANRTLEPRAFSNAGIADYPRKSLRFGEGGVGWVAEHRQPLNVPDRYADERFFAQTWAKKHGFVSFLGVPVVLGGSLLAVLVLNGRQPFRLDPDDQSLLDSFVAHAAIAIENARLYDEVLRHAAELESRVRARTAELEDALRVKTEFLGKMSHEFRTPLNFILGFSDLLRQEVAGPVSPKQATYLDRIQRGGRRLLSLVTDVLDIAQMDVGKSRLQLEPVILGSLVQEVLGLVQAQASKKRLGITTSLDSWLPFIVADRFKLGQVLFRLVSNAVKFTPEGGRITVTARRVPGVRGQGPGTDSEPPIPDPRSPTPATGEWLELAVADTGIGIRPEDLETIFAAFHQVDGSDARAYEGAGLGLTLVGRFVEQHGGRVWAESPGLGQGARFVVRLPRLEIPRAMTVLFVEDDEMMRASLTSALESAGFKVIQAADGSQALAALAGEPPDLLILDLVLPDMDGWEILRRVRVVEEIPRFPVLVITGLEGASAEEALRLGADEFLAKPVSPRVFVDTVLRLLAQPVVARRAQAERPRD